MPNARKLIRNLDDNTYELYDLSADRKEQINMWTDINLEASTMRTQLSDMLNSFSDGRKISAEPVQLSKEQIETLKSLGYVE